MSQQSWSEFFLSFDGRVGRRRFWLHYILLLVLPAVILAVIIDVMTGHYDENGPGMLVYLLILWPSLAVQVKRWHDRDKSGWWILISLIPIIGGIWAFVETGILAGTPGPNRFGPNPDEAQQTIPPALQ